MPSCKQIARYFLSLVDDNCGDALTNLKLQKLLYYAQGFHLAIYRCPLFPEQIEAWEYGPVVPRLYHALKLHGGQRILAIEGTTAYPRLDKRVQNLLDEIYSVYGQFSAFKLMSMTHQEPPWLDTPRGEVISQAAMMKYFRTRLRK